MGCSGGQNVYLACMNPGSIPSTNRNKEFLKDKGYLLNRTWQEQHGRKGHGFLYGFTFEEMLGLKLQR